MEAFAVYQKSDNSVPVDILDKEHQIASHKHKILTLRQQLQDKYKKLKKLQVVQYYNFDGWKDVGAFVTMERAVAAMEELACRNDHIDPHYRVVEMDRDSVDDKLIRFMDHPLPTTHRFNICSPDPFRD